MSIPSAPEPSPFQSPVLIVGLGNPGAKYEKTRHNIGFEIVKKFASKYNLPFKNEKLLNAEVAKGVVNNRQLILLLPQTYMNLSGEAVFKTVRYFRLFESPRENIEKSSPSSGYIQSSNSAAFSQILVIADDVYTPYGSFRLKERGASGGHNGLKNIELHLKTQHYPRLKVGVGPLNQDYSQKLDLGETLEDYVLGKFTGFENLHLLQVIENGVKVIEAWLTADFQQAATLTSKLKIVEEKQ